MISNNQHKRTSEIESIYVKYLQNSKIQQHNFWGWYMTSNQVGPCTWRRNGKLLCCCTWVKVTVMKCNEEPLYKEQRRKNCVHYIWSQAAQGNCNSHFQPWILWLDHVTVVSHLNLPLIKFWNTLHEHRESHVRGSWKS